MRRTWRSLGARGRNARIIQWSVAPVSLVAGGVLVASANPVNDEAGFAAGLAAAALGFVAGMIITKGAGSGG